MKRLTNNLGKAIIGIIGAIAAGGIITVSTLTNNTSIPIEYREKSNIHVVIAHGHGPIINGVYTTSGKQSPQWADSTKIYEGDNCRELLVMLVLELMRNDIDVTWINSFNTDMSLQERVTKVNELYKGDKRVIFLELHHNAQPTDKGDYTDPYGLKGYTSTTTGGATGIESFTSVGWTESDSINNYYIIPELKKAFPDVVWRKGPTHNGKEANFYVLKYTNCPAVLIEWMFMTTWNPDCKMIMDDVQKQIYINAIVEGLKRYNHDRQDR